MEEICFVEDVVASVATMMENNDNIQDVQQRSNRKGCAARTKIVFADSSDDDAEQHDVHTDAAGEKRPASSVVEVCHEYNLELDEDQLVDEALTVEQDVVDSFFEDVAPTTMLKRQPLLDAGFQAGVGNTEQDDLRPRFVRAVQDAQSAISTRKRFRDEDDSEAHDDCTLPPREDSCEVITATEVKHRHGPTSPRVSADGDGGAVAEVIAVARDLDGYLLTLDEADLQDEFEPADGEEDEEEEDEEDEGLDDLVVVSAVEQLVRCCSSEDQSEEEKAAYAPFLEKASVALKQLYDKDMTLDDFSTKMSVEIHRLQGAQRRLSRPPKDAPIVINGITMDM